MDCLKLCRRCRLRRESQVLQVSRFCRRCGFAGTATFAGAVSSADAAVLQPLRASRGAASSAGTAASQGAAGCHKLCRRCSFYSHCGFRRHSKFCRRRGPPLLLPASCQRTFPSTRRTSFAGFVCPDVCSRRLFRAANPVLIFRPAFSHFVRCAKIRRSVFTECYLCRRCEYPRGKGGATSAFAAHSVSAARAGCVQPAPCFPRLPHGLAAWQQESLQKKISAVLCSRLPAVLRLASLPRGYLVPPARIAAVSFRPA